MIVSLLFFLYIFFFLSKDTCLLLEFHGKFLKQFSVRSRISWFGKKDDWARRMNRNSQTLDSFSREIISREGGELVGKEKLRINLRINRPVQEIKNIGILNCSAHVRSRDRCNLDSAYLAILSSFVLTSLCNIFLHVQGKACRVYRGWGTGTISRLAL